MSNIAHCAASWWRDQIITDSNYKSTDDESEALARALFCRDVSDNQLTIFEAELSKLISSKLKSTDNYELRAKYFPCLDLEVCFNIAEIEPSCLPWHLYMQITKEGIFVKTRAHSTFEKIYDNQ